jgi:RNA polymerase sigma-70 factor (ECF subfamily)
MPHPKVYAERVTMTNEELIPLALAGDQDAYTQLFKNLNRIVMKTSNKFFKWGWMGIDFEADCYAHILMNLHKFKGTSKFSTWATRVAINVALMMLRQAKARENRNISIDDTIMDDGSGSSFAQTIPDPRDAFAALEAKWDVDRLLAEVSPNKRYAIASHILDGVSFRELAINMGKTVPATKSLVRRGLFQAREAA